MNLSGQEENIIGSSFKQRISNESDDDNDDFGEDEELSAEQLAYMVERIANPESPEFLLESLDFLSKYAENYHLPPAIAQNFYEIIVALINSEHPPEINPPLIDVIGSIQKSFQDSSDIDYSVLLTFLFAMIPEYPDSALESIASLIANHEEAAKIMLPKIPEFLAHLGEPDNCENTLDIFIGLSSCEAILSNIVIYLGQFMDQCIDLDDPYLIDIYIILTNFAQTEMGVEIISEHHLISAYFEKAKTDDQISAAYKLLNEILKRLSNPIRFLEKIDGFHFITDAITSNDQKLMMHGLILCQTISENKYGIDYMLTNNIVEILFKLTEDSFNVSQRAFNVICNIISEGPVTAIPSFIEAGFLIKMMSYLGNTTTDPKLINSILCAIQTVILYSKETSNVEAISEISTELFETLDAFIGHKELGAIAIYIQEQLGELE